MAHQISVTSGVAEVVCGSNQAPWHKLGEVVAGLMTAKEALEKAHLNWEVCGMPVTVNGNVLPFPSEEGRVDTWQGITRKDTGACLGIMKGQYECIQNAEAFQFFDNLIGQGKAVYDTAGALRGGKQVWLLAKIDGTIKINGEDHRTYGLMLTSHDGSYSLQVQWVLERVVCANTLSVALKGASNVCKIRHTPNWKNMESEAARVLGLGEHYFKSIQECLNGLNEKLLTKEQMADFTALLLPVADETKDNTRIKNIRSEISDLFTKGEGNKGASRWDALQAVTDYADHSMTIRGKNSSRLESSLQGAAAELKDKAFELLTSEDIMNDLLNRPHEALTGTPDANVNPFKELLAKQ
jgi:phage/plasmid-like protein (TIGR03299 family)